MEELKKRLKMLFREKTNKNCHSTEVTELRFAEVFNQGLIENNGLYRQTLGLCPALAVTATVINSLGLGAATLAVLLASNFLISLIRDRIPAMVRIPCYIIIIASFVTIVEMFLEAFSPELHSALGIFVPLIVTNCLILGRAEIFASKESTTASIADALGIGLGFTIALMSIGLIRELLGSGSLLGWPVIHKIFDWFGLSYQPATTFVQPAGAFFVLGFLLAVVNIYFRK